MWGIAGPTKINNNKVPLNTLPFNDCNEPTMQFECDSSDCKKEHDDAK